MKHKKSSYKKRYVYGTRTKKWHLIGKSDRDWKYGFTPSTLKRIGRARAKKIYLSGRILR